MTEMICCFETIADHLLLKYGMEPSMYLSGRQISEVTTNIFKIQTVWELANGEVQGFKVGSRFDDTSNCDDITRLSGTWGT